MPDFDENTWDNGCTPYPVVDGQDLGKFPWRSCPPPIPALDSEPAEKLPKRKVEKVWTKKPAIPVAENKPRTARRPDKDAEPLEGDRYAARTRGRQFGDSSDAKECTFAPTRTKRMMRIIKSQYDWAPGYDKRSTERQLVGRFDAALKVSSLPPPPQRSRPPRHLTAPPRPSGER